MNAPQIPAIADYVQPAQLDSLADMAAVLDLIIDDQAGWLCIGWIEGNPDTESMQQQLFYVPTERAKAVAKLTAMAEQFGNIYARMCLFQKLTTVGKRGEIYAVSADYEHALPSRLIWKDDCRIDTPASLLIETSPNNYQALIVLDRPASTNERKRLMTTWRDAGGGDTCSADAVHFIRLPGGRNNKPGKNAHLVQLAVHTTRTYSADKLLARCGPVSEGTHTPSSYSSDDWRDLPDGAALWQSRRWQALVTRQRPQLKTLLIDRQPIALPNKRTDRTNDDSWSNQRAVFVANVLSAYDPPPLDELRAVAWHFRDYLGQRKTDRQYQVDIDNLIAEYTHRYYTSKGREYLGQPTKYLQPRPATAPAPAERVARGRAGNHADLVEHVYQALLAQSDGTAAIVKLGQLAGDLGMHSRTLSTILDELAEAGRIGKRKQAGRNSGVYIPIQGMIYSEEPIAELPMAARQTDESAPDAIESTSTRLDQGGVYSQIAEADQTLPALDVAQLVAEAVDAYGTRYIPGQVRPVDRVVAYINANGGQGIHRSAIEEAYRALLDRRRYQRQDEREARKASKMRLGQLQRHSRALATQAEAIERAAKLGVELPPVLEFEYNGKTYKTRTPKTPTLRYAGFIRHLAGIYAAEEARRQPEIELTTHELWAQVDTAAYEQARPKIKITRRGPVAIDMPEPTPVPAVEQHQVKPSGPALAASLIARLQAQAAQRLQAAL